jgi:tRNA-(ms[2]io[6]A)-hydroxylase
MSNNLQLDDFLACSTPDEWINSALKNQDLLLIDHANCEKKAAAAAMHLIHRYQFHEKLLHKMARLAREELAHFQKVVKILSARNIPYRFIEASRYANGLRTIARKQEPGRLVDLLIIGAFIEARSCERFNKLAPFLDEDLQKFYNSLYACEHRHFTDYLTLAEEFSPEPIEERVEQFRQLECDLIQSPDTEFRFHSGICQ